MRNGKILFLIILLLFFYNLQAALVTHLKFENDFEDNYGDNNGSNMPASNDVSFVFRPKINGLPVFVEDISIEYDAGGLYQIRSRIPYSITLSRSGRIKSEEKVLEEALESVTIEEAEKRKMMYAMNEKGELELSYVISDEERMRFITISLGGEQ